MGTHYKLDIPKMVFAARKIRILNHPVRVRIIELLSEHEKLNVTQIIEMLNLTQADTSQQLLRLLESGYLKRLKQGRMKIYSLNQDVLEKVINITEEIGVRK